MRPTILTEDHGIGADAHLDLEEVTQDPGLRSGAKTDLGAASRPSASRTRQRAGCASAVVEADFGMTSYPRQRAGRAWAMRWS